MQDEGGYKYHIKYVLKYRSICETWHITHVYVRVCVYNTYPSVNLSIAGRPRYMLGRQMPGPGLQHCTQADGNRAVPIPFYHEAAADWREQRGLPAVNNICTVCTALSSSLCCADDPCCCTYRCFVCFVQGYESSENKQRARRTPCTLMPTVCATSKGAAA